MSILLPLLIVGLVVSVASLGFADSAGRPQANAERLRVYLGTASQHGSKGIYLADLDLKSAKLGEPRLVAQAENPSFLAKHPTQPWMYSVGEYEQADGDKTGGVYAFALDKASGELTRLNSQPSSGKGPCYITVDPQGRNVLVANYGSGSVAVLPIEADGRLGEASCVVQHEGASVNQSRQEGPHAHAVQVHPSGRWVFAADLGTDKLVGYRYDSQAGTLEADEDATATTAPGAGPRHFAFHPTLDTLYLINELDSTVVALRFDADAGRMETLQTLTTLPEGFEGDNYPSEIAVHPSGRFVYGANRGHDSLAVFRVDKSSGELTAAGHVPIEGKFPRHFAIDPTGQVLIAAHQNSDDLSIFRIDQETGQPQFTGQHVKLGMPMAVLYLPAGE